MKSSTSAFLSGVIFAIGLGIAQMTRPDKVLNFFNLVGNWDPTFLLALMMGTGIFLQGYYLLMPMPVRNVLEMDKFPAGTFTPHMLAGAVIFGVGVGLIGLSPATAIVNLASLKFEVLLYVVGMLLGIYATKAYLYRSDFKG